MKRPAALGRGILLAALAGGLLPTTPGVERPRLEPGLRVEVKGTFLPDGSLLADEVERRDEQDRDEELRGNISAIDPDRRTLRLLGFEVLVPDTVPVVDDRRGPARLEDLRPGLRVKVDGMRDERGRFVASKIRIREDQYRETKLVGQIESFEAAGGGMATLRLVGVLVRLGDGTDYAGFGEAGKSPVRRRLGVLDDDDVQISGRLRLGRRIAFGGEFRLRSETLERMDLGVDDTPRQLIPEVTGIFGMTVDMGRWFSYIEMEGAREYLIEGPFLGTDHRDRTRLELGEAYVEYQALASRSLSVAIGRQKFNETREWYFNNKHVDALRVAYNRRHWGVEASISRNVFNDVTYEDERSKTNLIVQAHLEPFEDWRVEGFFVERRDRREKPDSPRLLGLRLLGEPGRHLELWLDAAVERGERNARVDHGERSLRPIRARAFDIGVSLRSRWKMDPTLTVGLASATGDDPSTADVDESFRQSGLHRNRGHWRGVVSFRYYGEALDPDLQNLSISTLALGLRPATGLSVDLVYHGYRQDQPARVDFNTDLDTRPRGLHGRIGH
ncbi:MAG: alginate export family protein, partial [Acidobacteriota bacterium]|nr:alginate export family protein [Acidobacteriota bacterium]